MWKDISGWENYYEVNDSGEVRNKLTGALLIGDINSAGYYRVCLYNKENIPSKQRFFRHRLVAEHFIDNPLCLPEVNHKDADISNNCVDNLEWVTKKENELHSRKYGDKEYKPFKVVYKNGHEEIFDVTPNLADKLNVTKRTIMNWLQKESCGFKQHNIISIEYI